ncbi:SDR family oxidoreductase [Rhizobium sp. KVB221]|uniref:SDR family oxidoreductase n=1 Tax=Rhizobium setariae TaxID=2801340 RepID=A0A936YJR2_9HYPH|nr:SDR family oxidoreductase [Rhizobium setariae]MBL0371560.1 SDR family oxidoreductase [Rhizobium setariae]
MSANARRLEGKTAIVTAAAQGIGRAIAERFAEEGAIVHACDVDEVHLSSLVTSGIKTHKLDCSDEVAVDRVFGEIGPSDILVNAVGWVFHGAILDTGLDAWRRSFLLNVDTAFFAIRAALPSMLEAGKGSIINIASAASSVKGFPNRAAYGATKAALVGLTKAIAADHVAQGIRCNAICPGTVESPSLQERINQFADPVAARAAFIARQPMGRLGTPGEIAALAAYLAADESAYMTGSSVIIDGGSVN